MCVLVLTLNLCLGCAPKDEAVPENTPLPLEGNLEAKERALGKIKVESQNTMGSNAARLITSGRANPFLTIDEAATFGQSGREVLTDINLSAIFYSDKNSYAIMDGFIVRVGDMFGDKTVMNIEKRAVILKDDLGEYMVLVKDE